MIPTSRAAALFVALALAILLFIIVKKVLRQKIKSKMYQPIKKQKRLRGIEYYNLFLGVKSGKIVEAATINKNLKPSSEEYVNIWYINSFEGRKVVLYYHGNSHNVSYRKYMMDICRILRLNLLLVDYRGYGKSSGEASPVNVLEDADVSYNFLIKEGHSPSNIIVWSESLGGTPACYIAGKYPVGCLILLSTFASIHSLLRDETNAIREAAFFVLRSITEDINDKTNNVELIKGVDPSCPVIILHSREDTMIPYSNAIELISALPANHNKRLIEIRGEHDGPKISHQNFRDILQVIGLNEVSDKEVDEIIRIIDNLSMVSQSNSSYLTGEK